LGLSELVEREMNDIHQTMFFLKDLKKDFIKKRHWHLIFAEMGIASFKEEFTLVDI